ncbi:FtsX-like permease family protein [Clostridium gasigenes]|uniref:Putative ABC transport system permease protein n=1 Tax=Clostridium gasigenes TaxID=94869 RepID=A0A1H0NMZ8_9CLOT|nr:FtsX-like permease family protein [Clostridium gasigenes]MBB6623648.1 ABC transporter permease [Clostridium gasigenes]SDO93710.1 putative ABC transport system permease protein [Clostridium gasigenes]
MKNALLKDTFREIKKSFGRFVSIFAIVTLGVAFFAGIKAAAPDMRITADKYYDDYNFMDLRLLSTLGFNENDIDKIKKYGNIEGIFPTSSMDVLTTINNNELVLKIHALPKNNLSNDNKDYINRPKIVEGRLPENPGECVIGKGDIREADVKIGSKLKITSGTNDDISKSFKIDEFQVVGIVETPYYLTFEKGTSNIGNGRVSNFIMVSEKDMEIDCYKEVLITIKDAKKLNSFNKKYEDFILPSKNSLEDIGESKWYVLDRNSNYSFVDYDGSADRVSAIAQVFPLFFFLVAALVCLTTMTRMVDEQRINIGTLKALGYSKLAIASKYILYAAFASIGGSIAGIAIGFTVFPIVIVDAYSMLYTLPPVILKFDVLYASIATLSAVLITTLAAFLACNKELIEMPSLLMRPKAPKEGKRILLERIPFIWNRFNFSKKVTARNIFRYKKRFFMTVIGIAGCTALLLAGFGIKDSIEAIVEKQFGEVYKYNMTIGFDSNTDMQNQEEIIKEVSKNGEITDYTSIKTKNVDVSSDEATEAVTIIVPKYKNEFNNFIDLKSRKNKEEVEIQEDGIILTEKAAKQLKVRIGDTIYIDKEENEKVPVKIRGISEQYVMNYVYMTDNLYEKIFKEEIKFNKMFAILADKSKESEDKLSKDILKESKVTSVSFNSLSENSFKETISSLNYVVLIMIISAGALAFVVLYNLTNVNISERIREIATIKVLGFYDNEVSAYVYRENFVLTFIGTLTGLGLGVLLHKFIMITAEPDNMMFGRNIDFMSFLYASILTLAFASIVNFVMYFKLKKTPMVESLKSVD